VAEFKLISQNAYLEELENLFPRRLRPDMAIPAGNRNAVENSYPTGFPRWNSQRQ